MTINGQRWRIYNVSPTSMRLVRPDGTRTIGMTDGSSRTIYLANSLRGRMRDKVMAHELVHAFNFSYGIYMDIDQEEFMADWVSRYGRELIYILDNIMSQVKRA